MKKNMKLAFIAIILAFVGGQTISAQGSLLKKLKSRAEDEVVKGVFGDSKKSDEPAYEQTKSDASPGNIRGEGLTQTVPNVPENISDAGTAFKARSYSEARNSVRQAILGIEMEIGQNILDGLPQTVKGLDMVSDEDKVSSTSMGFVGLTIERVYRGGDQEMKITVGNDATLLSSVNMYMSTAVYSSSTDQNHKQVKFKGYTGILEYDDYSGYTLSVPFGQSSIFIAGGINFANEKKILAAAEEIDIEKIKKELGE